MNLKIDKSSLNGNIIARPSKSYAHRYLIGASLAKGKSIISNIDFSNDILATLNCIYAYGRNHYRNFENRTVKFTDEMKKNFMPTFDCNESGTTLRIFFPIAIEKYNEVKFIGSERLIERGVDIYEKIFKNIIFSKDKYSINTKGNLIAGNYELIGNVSSQYISGLLFALPLLKDDSKITIITNLESKNYVLMTLETLKNFNINIETNIYNISNNTSNNIEFNIKGNQEYIANDFEIEGDFSNIAFIDAFNYFNNKINITGLNNNSLQSDKIYKKYFDELNEKSITIDISNCIDLAPILMTFATLKNGAIFTNTKRLEIKESNRGKVMAHELEKCNASIEVLDNSIIINKKELQKPTQKFFSHNDHRIAMALSLLSTKFNIEIENSECINKSYPSYFDDLKSLGAIIS